MNILCHKHNIDSIMYFCTEHFTDIDRYRVGFVTVVIESAYNTILLCRIRYKEWNILLISHPYGAREGRGSFSPSVQIRQATLVMTQFSRFICLPTSPGPSLVRTQSIGAEEKKLFPFSGRVHNILL